MSVGIRRRLSRAATAAAVCAAIAGALLSSGAASAATAPHGQRAAAHQFSPSSPVTFTWHNLALINGWQSAAALGYASPAYAISGGVVYLRGEIFQQKVGSEEFAVLPKAARPQVILYRTVYTYGLTTGTLQINADGVMQAVSSPTAPDHASYTTSLGGVSYPVGGFIWHKLALLHGWQHAPTSYDTGVPAYAIKGGVVYLAGSLVQSSGTNRLFAVLPKAARPAHKMFLLTYTFGYTLGAIEITPNGAMYASSWPNSNAREFTSLAAVSFPAPGVKWHLLAPLHGWKSAQPLYGTGDPAYTVIGGVVYLSGSLRQPSGTSNWCLTLPPAGRPGHFAQFAVYTLGGTSGVVQPDQLGNTSAGSFPDSNSMSFTSLAAISFPRTS
jgi:hypothetical protein